MAALADMMAVDFAGRTYRIDASGRGQLIPNAPSPAFNSLAVSDTGRMYSVGNNRVYQLDPDTGDFFTSVALSIAADVRGLTWNLGELWAIQNGAPDRLVRINPNNGNLVVVGNTGFTDLQSLAVFNSTLYSWSLLSGLVSVNSATGLATDVNAGVGGGNIQAMETDNDGRLIGYLNPNFYQIRTDGTRVALPGTFSADIRGIAPIKRFEKMVGYGTADEYEFDSADKYKTRGPYGATVAAAATGPDGSHYIAFSTGDVVKEEPNSNLRFAVGNPGFQVRAMTFRLGVLFAARNNAGNDNIYTLDTTNMSPTFVGSSGQAEVVGMATQPGTNQIFAFDTANGLCTMNAVTGLCTDVSGANLGNAQIQSLEFYESGVLRGAGFGYWDIIPTTGALSLIQGLPTGMGGLCLLRKPGTMYAVDWASSALLKVDMRTGTGNLVFGFGGDPNSMTMGGDGRLYIGTIGPTIGVFDLNTNTISPSWTFAGRDWRGLAWLGNDLYGISDAAPSDTLWRINPIFGTSTLVGNTGFALIQSLTTSPDGTMYAYDLGAGLLTVNPLTGAATDVNPGVGAVLIQGLEFGLLDRLYGARDDLYTLNTPTGLSTLIGGAGYSDLRGLGYVRGQTRGVIRLNDFPFGDARNEIIQLQIRKVADPSWVFEIHFVQTDQLGNCGLTTDVEGHVQIIAKASHWLARSASTFLNRGSTFNLALTNGDLDGNNVIDSDDFDIIVANFGGGPTGDLDGNNLVDSDDFDIVVKNFGDVGDQ
ncbi:MAG TPA: hypothetical protein PLH94_02105 [Fimbriimonadaceae bacterium]|nr:hypothetical protein [Fimbriimonadaceae bacterium]